MFSRFCLLVRTTRLSSFVILTPEIRLFTRRARRPASTQSLLRQSLRYRGSTTDLRKGNLARPDSSVTSVRNALKAGARAPRGVPTFANGRSPAHRRNPRPQSWPRPGSREYRYRLPSLALATAFISPVCPPRVTCFSASLTGQHSWRRPSILSPERSLRVPSQSEGLRLECSKHLGDLC